MAFGSVAHAKLTQQGRGLPEWGPAGGVAGLCRAPHPHPSKRAVETAFPGNVLHSLPASGALHAQMMTCSIQWVLIAVGREERAWVAAGFMPAERGRGRTLV